jgi:hypothetical protein
MGIGKLKRDKRQRREATTAVLQDQERLRMMPQQSIILEDCHMSTRE